ncbi:hypothetical protein [Paenibacillus hamazuiensis]|uniref:hypothetical protein n=1 Tax=Paenibacillus hamazuiensis TaxID=2936508 RepID=UPI0020109E6E|nr:hypothetical protein [Paenibacillus hamazuiensis]
MLNVLLLLAAIAVVIGVIWAAPLVRRQPNQEWDYTMSEELSKHPIRSNPALVGLILFPVIVFFGAAIWLYYYR